MDDVQAAKAPIHLWIVGILSLIWNGFGCTDYLMTRMHNMEWLAQSGGDPQAMLDWVDGFPIWAQSGWALGVWMGLLGAVLLLLRSRWAVWSFGLSLVGAILGLGYQITMAPPLAGADDMFSRVMPYVIILVAVALFLYARAQAAKGILR